MVTIDCIAFIPTLKKARSTSAGENPILYESNVLRHILALVSLSSYNVATMFHSIAMIITNSAMVASIYRGHSRKK
ncbi:hypothetical protein EBR96_07695 [bacterium]|nr:hypothetical protein [bacterium]